MSSFFKHNYNIISDEALMRSISDGKEDAFNEIYKRYAKKMLFFFYSKLYKNEEKANDFLQDLFLKIIAHPKKFDASKNFSTWIYSLANNMCKNEYRKNEVRKLLNTEMDSAIVSENESSGYLDQQDVALFNKELHHQLDNLEESKRTTFILRYQQHFSLKEISEIMECSEGTVKSRLFYALKKLAEKLNIFNPQL
jgi:RNA polymerase sigma-70 factor (ECF subfamily)